jgi:acyl-CoA synthetase (AMP-forming)/AMP-acid ligase II
LFKVVHESLDSATLAELARGWDSPSSFTLLPQPSPFSRDHLAEFLSKLPVELQKDHFGLLTSGSTGTPKLVIGRKSRTAALIAEIERRQDLAPVRSTVMALPLSYSYGFVNQWLWAHLNQRRLVATAGLADPAGFFEALDREVDTMLCLVGSQVPILRNFLGKGRQFPYVIRLNFAGGLFPQADLAWLEETFSSARILHNFGCAEALPRLTIRDARDRDDPLVLGPLVEGAEFSLSEAGMLAFRSPYGAVAIADAESVRLHDPTDWIETGDAAELLEDGTYRLLGRKSDVFKRFGEKVSLPTLAASLREVWPGALAFYLDPSDNGEPAHVLLLSPHPDSEAMQKILRHLRTHFRRPLWPVRLEAAAEIPLSRNGKPDVEAIRLLPRDVMWRQRF